MAPDFRQALVLKKIVEDKIAKGSWQLPLLLKAVKISGIGVSSMRVKDTFSWFLDVRRWGDWRRPCSSCGWPCGKWSGGGIHAQKIELQRVQSSP